MVGDLFGRKHFAKIRGYMSIFYVWSSVAGPVTSNRGRYDSTHTYEPMLWMLIGSFSLASLFYGVILKPWGKTRAQITPRIDNDV